MFLLPALYGHIIISAWLPLVSTYDKKCNSLQWQGYSIGLHVYGIWQISHALGTCTVFNIRLLPCQSIDMLTIIFLK